MKCNYWSNIGRRYRLFLDCLVRQQLKLLTAISHFAYESSRSVNFFFLSLLLASSLRQKRDKVHSNGDFTLSSPRFLGRKRSVGIRISITSHRKRCETDGSLLSRIKPPRGVLLNNLKGIVSCLFFPRDEIKRKTMFNISPQE